MIKTLIGLFKEKTVGLKSIKPDVLATLGFSLLFIALCITFWGRLGDPFIDCGREFYIPQAMLNGKLLIRDIFYLYNPLAMQINANLYKLFGGNFTVLYLAGIANAYLILAMVYLIMRTIFKPLVSFTAVLSVMAFGVFQSGIFNYIVPYSYTITYALTGALISIYFAICAIKNKDNTHFKLLMYLSFFFLGFSLANKFDYYLLILPVLAIPVLFRKFSILDYFYCLLSLIFFPLASYSSLFSQGLSPNNLSEYITFGQNFFKAESLLHDYKRSFLFSWDKYFYLNSVYFIKYALFMFFNYKLITFCLKKITAIPLRLICFTALLIFNLKLITAAKLLQIEYAFCWFVPFTILSLLLYIYLNRKDKSFLTSQENLICFFILLCSIAATARTNFFVNMDLYGSYTIPLIMASLFIVILKFFPTLFKTKNTENLNFTVPTMFIIFSLLVLNNTHVYRKTFDYAIAPDKGQFYTTYGQSLVINETVKYIKNTVPEKATCLVLPEGSIINFLSDRKSDDKHYHLIPNHIETLGEDNIVKDLNTTRPEYVFITDRLSSEYGADYFCKDYAYKICDFITSNYDFQKDIKAVDDRAWDGSTYTSAVRIYKLKR